jgi:hypothetical protein
MDGSRTNCRASNLKWVSKEENEAHKLVHGTVLKGESHPSSKLSEDDVRIIRSFPQAPRRVLADRFNVTRDTISQIRNRSRWAASA